VPVNNIYPDFKQENNNMKKLVALIALAITVLTFNATAQEDSATEDGVRFGLKGGFNMSNVYDQQGNDNNTDMKFGLAAGGFLHFPLGPVLGFQPELLFSQKGFRGTGQSLGTTYEFSRTTNYLDVPLLLALKPGSNVALFVGPHISYLISQRDVVKKGDYNSVRDQHFKNDNPRRNTVGLMTGADIYLHPLILAARVGWDFSNNNGDGTSSSPTYKNAWLQVCLGFNL
jgi:hypothetical protein